MSFLKLKFLSLTTLFFLFLTNVAADCVDLTAIYTCEPGSTYELHGNKQGTYIYLGRYSKIGFHTEKFNFFGQSAILCDEEVGTYPITLSRLLSISLSNTVQELSFSDDKERLSIALYNLKNDGQTEHIMDVTCEKIPTP